MGCGKSKHDVASGNTVIQHKKSRVNSMASQENGTETRDNNNNNNRVDNLSPGGVEVEQKESGSVQELGDGYKPDEGNDVELEGEAEKTNVQEVKEAEKLEVNDKHGKKDDSLKEEDEKVNGANIAGAAEEENTGENEKDVSVKEEDMKDTNVSSSKGEEKHLKAEELCEGQ